VIDLKNFYRENGLFLVWAPPNQGSSRSRAFARELGIEELHYVYLDTRRSRSNAPVRYAYQAVKTLRLLFQKRPEVVFVQNPPSFAVPFVYLYCALSGGVYIIDSHSDVFQRDFWNRPRWLHRFLAKKAAATIVTDEHFQARVNEWGGRSRIIRDPITPYATAEFPTNGGFSVVVVNKYADDEPLAEVLAAAAELEDISFYVTGKKSKANPEMLAKATSNVCFTDFLPDAQYYGLLNACQVVMSLTTRDHTLQCGACEAMSLEKPVITSNWPLLQSYFHQGTVHVDNTGEDIRRGILEIKANYEAYTAGMRELRTQHREEWESNVVELTQLIRQTAEGG